LLELSDAGEVHQRQIRSLPHQLVFLPLLEFGVRPSLCQGFRGFLHGLFGLENVAVQVDDAWAAAAAGTFWFLGGGSHNCGCSGTSGVLLSVSHGSVRESIAAPLREYGRATAIQHCHRQHEMLNGRSPCTAKRASVI
jgi:hypothetical protein